MLLQSKRKPLLTCDVLHSLPGRIRIGCRALIHLSAHRKELEDRLESDFAISKATVSPLSENVLILPGKLCITSHVNSGFLLLCRSITDSLHPSTHFSKAMS